VQRVALGASGSHTVVITAGAGQVYINGVTVYDGNESSGLAVLNAGFHGSQSSVWNTTATNPLWRQNVTTLNPDLVTIMLGTNDYSSTLGRATYTANLTNVVNVIRDNVAGWPTILLISAYKENYTYVPAWEQYEYGLERMATDLGCAYLDLRTQMPDIGSAGDTQGYYADNIHPTVAGNEKTATVVSDLLISKSS
jgi:lysophospholipase L1-like esterase